MSSRTVEAGKVYRADETYGRVPNGLFLDTKISHGAIRLYAYLHWRYGKNQQAFPHQGTIARDLGVSEKTVSTWALELEMADWLIVLHRTNKETGKHISNKYHVFEVQAECTAKRVAWKVAKPQPKEAPERKSRKGIGGPRKDNDETTRTQVPMDHQNSSSDGIREAHQNSSSDKPTALSTELDSLSGGGEIKTTVQPSPVVTDDFKALTGRVVEVVHKGNSKMWGVAGLLANWMLCRADHFNSPQSKHWLEWLPDRPFTLIEALAFLLWYEDLKIAWPSSPQKWNGKAYEFRKDSRRAQYMRMAMERHAPQVESQPTDYERAMAAAIQAAEQAAAA